MEDTLLTLANSEVDGGRSLHEGYFGPAYLRGLEGRRQDLRLSDCATTPSGNRSAANETSSPLGLDERSSQAARDYRPKSETSQHHSNDPSLTRLQAL